MITVHSLIAKIKRPEPISKVTVQTRMYYMIQYYTVCRHLVILHGNVLLTHKRPLKGPVVQFCFFLCTGDKKEMYVLIFVISQRPFQTQPVYGQATYMATRAHTLRCVYLLNGIPYLLSGCPTPVVSGPGPERFCWEQRK
jgi:hypothetical protein